MAKKKKKESVYETPRANMNIMADAFERAMKKAPKESLREWMDKCQSVESVSSSMTQAA